jgi:type IV secretory pathway VirB3-like protein
LVGVAVNVTDVPEQILLEGETPKLTVGVTLELTAIVMVFDVAVFVVKQVPPLIVITQITWSLLAIVLEVNVFKALFCMLLPFTLKS